MEWMRLQDVTKVRGKVMNAGRVRSIGAQSRGRPAARRQQHPRQQLSSTLAFN